MSINWICQPHGLFQATDVDLRMSCPDCYREAKARIAELEAKNAKLDTQCQAMIQERRMLLTDEAQGELRRLRLYLKDTSDDMECLPECDSYGHADDCPVTNVMQAFRNLRESVAALEKENVYLKEVIAAPTKPRYAQLIGRIDELEAALSFVRSAVVALRPSDDPSEREITYSIFSRIANALGESQ